MPSYCGIRRYLHTHTQTRLTSGAHINEGVVDQNQFVEVKLVGEPFPFGLMKDPLVVVISVKQKEKTKIKHSIQNISFQNKLLVFKPLFCASDL